jgi:hypothetical protein
MTYSGGKKALACGKCGYSRPLGRDTDQVAERSMGAGVSWEGFTRGVGPGISGHQCQTCKASLATPGDAAPAACPFCKGGDFASIDQHNKVLEPFGIIPFTFPREQARAKLLGWFRQGWFLPQDLPEAARPERIHGVYLPFFMVDGFTRSTWKGLTAIMVSELQKGALVQKEVWDPTVGYYEHFFDNVLIHLSGAIPEKALQGEMGFNFGQAVAYDPRYLRGWTMELYSKKEQEGLQAATDVINKSLAAIIEKKIPGTSHKDLKITSEQQAVAFRHVLAPMWIASYTYRGKRYPFWINGQTGNLIGEKPLSAERLTLAIGIGLIVLTLLVILVRGVL